MTCVGAASRLGATYSIYIASSDTLGVYDTLRGSGVLFVPSPGLNNCMTGRLPRGRFTFCRNNYPHRVMYSTTSMTGTHTTRPRTLLLIRPRYHPRIIRRTSCINSAANVVTCTRGSSTGRFVVNARGDVIRRLSCTYPRGQFCPLTIRLAYVGVGLAALVSVCRYLRNDNNRRVALPRSIVRKTKHYVHHVIRLNN